MIFVQSLTYFASARHLKNEVDYIYNFGITRFSSLDHFLMSSVLYKYAVNHIFMHHNVDNLSDHAPIFLHINLFNNLLRVSDNTLSKKQQVAGRSVAMLT